MVDIGIFASEKSFLFIINLGNYLCKLLGEDYVNLFQGGCFIAQM